MLSRFLYNLHRYMGNQQFERNKTLAQEMQWWPKELVLEWQWTKVEELLEHAQKSVPYYQSLFKGLGIDARDIRSWDDFACLPILTKEEIQKNPENLLANGAQAIENRTGGSTGKPLRFYQDADYTTWARASLAWGFNLCGFEGGEKQVFLWGSDFDARPHESFKGRVLDRAYNVRFVNAFNMTDQHLKHLADELGCWQPDFMWGYVSTLDLLAERVIKDGIQLHPKGVQTTAGTLYPSTRKKLEQAFGRVIYDRYGSREVSIAAHECNEHQGLHEASFHNYIEISNGVNREVGNIIVTNLHNKAFPFIRYDTGDLAIPDSERCKCGRAFPLLKRIVGRTREVVTSPSGKLIDGAFFGYLFHNSKGVKQFQVVQETRNLLLIRIVKADDFQADILPYLEAKIKQFGDPEFNIQIEFVDSIPPLSSGKMAYVISKVPVKLA